MSALTTQGKALDEIVLHPEGNTYVGALATRFALGFLKLPPVFKLDASRFHVFEVRGAQVIHRASQSTRMAAEAFMLGDNRILVSRE